MGGNKKNIDNIIKASKIGAILTSASYEKSGSLLVDDQVFRILTTSPLALSPLFFF